MSCSSMRPKKGDRVTVFATIADVDHGKSATNLPFQLRIDGSAGGFVWVAGSSIDRVIERPLTVGDRVMYCGGVQRILHIIGPHVWVKREDCPDNSGMIADLSVLRRID